MRLIPIAGCVVLLSVACALWAGPTPGQSLSNPRIIYTAAKTFDALAWLHGGERFPNGANLFVLDGENPRRLISNFFASADAAVSFDATRVLFSGKQHPSDAWQIWEIPIVGGQPTRLTSCQEGCVFPLYLPEDRLVYARRIHERFQLEAMPLKGGESLPLTHIFDNAFPSDVLRDGRILFQAAYPLGSTGQPELYTVYSDGSGVESYRCDHGRSRHSGRQVLSGDIVFSVNGKLARFTSPLAHQVELTTPEGDYAGDVQETPNGDWVIAVRSSGKASYSIRVWNPHSNSLKTLAAKDRFDLIQPRLLGPAQPPHRHPSGLHDWDGANVLCLNAYTSKLTFADGTIATVRLYTQSSRGQRALLGSSPVEKDGSFFLHVPADQPLQFEILDQTGKILQRETGWYWMRRGEQRVCVGCHAGPERAPENAVPAVLVKSTEPVNLAVSHSGQPKGGH
jgi:Hydrazine synthase alpha subunit middle domain